MPRLLMTTAAVLFAGIAFSPADALAADAEARLSETVQDIKSLQERTAKPSARTTPNVCEAVADPGEAPMKDTTLFSRLALASYKVVILDEVHFQSVNLAYPDVFRKLKAAAPEIDCLYMEYAPGYEPRTRADALKDWAYGRPGGLFDTAYELGLKIVYVDAAKAPPRGGPESDGESVARRNPVMAERIASTLDAGACRAGVFIVGKAHGMSSYEGRTEEPVRDLLARRGLAAVSLDMIDRARADCGPNDGPCVRAFLNGRGAFRDNPREWKFSSCLGGGRDFAYGTGFLNRRTGSACAVPADADGWGSVCDFDATLFY